ncbi:MAG: hypothetical protein HY303_19390 [Candidatus Wallbacteria bacterium]|nr:hypothetical protein [Candidatus Wallbacteria bacterium]
MRLRKVKRGFSFLELFIGIVILMAGVIPIFWVMSGTSKGAKLTVQQVQATNHASNLLEAIRAAGFDAVSQFPQVMVQMEGAAGAWKFPEEAAALNWTQIAQTAQTEEQKKAFESFRLAFFDGKDPIVPPMEDNYRRYLVVQGSKSAAQPSEGMEDPTHAQHASADDGMIGVIVRVEWTNRSGDKPEERVPQYVELRTVLGDPYRFLGGGQ